MNPPGIDQTKIVASSAVTRRHKKGHVPVGPLKSPPLTPSPPNEAPLWRRASPNARNVGIWEEMLVQQTPVCDMNYCTFRINKMIVRSLMNQFCSCRAIQTMSNTKEPPRRPVNCELFRHGHVGNDEAGLLFVWIGRLRCFLVHRRQRGILRDYREEMRTERERMR